LKEAVECMNFKSASSRYCARGAAIENAVSLIFYVAFCMTDHVKKSKFFCNNENIVAL